MTETPIIMSFDLKKFRIRIHKSTIHMMGDPQYIQLLVNPEKMTVAVRAMEENEKPGKDAHKVSKQIMSSDNSYEIYSRAFLTKMVEVVGGLEDKVGYRISGVYSSTHKTALYSLQTITKIES